MGGIFPLSLLRFFPSAEIPRNVYRPSACGCGPSRGVLRGPSPRQCCRRCVRAPRRSVRVACSLFASFPVARPRRPRPIVARRRGREGKRRPRRLSELPSASTNPRLADANTLRDIPKKPLKKIGAMRRTPVLQGYKKRFPLLTGEFDYRKLLKITGRKIGLHCRRCVSTTKSSLDFFCVARFRAALRRFLGFGKRFGFE